MAVGMGNNWYNLDACSNFIAAIRYDKNNNANLLFNERANRPI